MRLYVDGQLEGIRIQGGEKTEWSCLDKDVERPNGDALELVLAAAGVVDEIRVSNCLRYGPFVPKGASNTTLIVGNEKSSLPPAAVAAGGPRLETSDTDLNEARLKKTASRIPSTSAAYVLPAGQAKAAWEGMAGMAPAKDYFGPGADGVGLDTNVEPERPSAIYWKLPDIKPGKYYLGLWQEVQGKPYNWPPNDPRVSEFWPEKMLTSAYLNGFPVRFASTSDPVQVKPGLWLAELQSAGPVELKPDDELAVRNYNGNFVYMRLALHREPPGAVMA